MVRHTEIPQQNPLIILLTQLQLSLQNWERTPKNEGEKQEGQKQQLSQVLPTATRQNKTITGFRTTNPYNIQLNKCETGPYFFQNFQFTTMFISVFCKSCEPMLCEPEIVQNFAADFQANPTDISCKIFE